MNGIQVLNKLPEGWDLNRAGNYPNQETLPFFVTYVPHRTGTFKINLFDQIESPEQFMFALQALEAADEENDVEIHLQCVGGSLDATDMFIHAMRKCKGHIHAVATGGCHSAATLILLEADSFELSQGFNSLIHCGSTGSVGNLNEFLKHTAFQTGFIPKIFQSYYEGFLSTEEIENLLKGQDIWLDAQGWYDRFNARNAYFMAKNEAIMNIETTPELTPEQVVGIMNIMHPEGKSAGKPAGKPIPAKPKAPRKKVIPVKKK